MQDYSKTLMFANDKYYCLAQTKGLTASRRQLNKAAQYYHSNDAISAMTFHSAFSKERSPENFRWARISVHVARAWQGYIILFCTVLSGLGEGVPFSKHLRFPRSGNAHRLCYFKQTCEPVCQQCWHLQTTHKTYKTITSFYNTHVKIIKLHIKIKFSSITKFSFQK